MSWILRARPDPALGLPILGRLAIASQDKNANIQCYSHNPEHPKLDCVAQLTWTGAKLPAGAQAAMKYLISATVSFSCV